MEVQFTPDQQAFLREAIQSGRIRREEDALHEALALWEERERAQAEILTAVRSCRGVLGARGGHRLDARVHPGTCRWNQTPRP